MSWSHVVRPGDKTCKNPSAGSQRKSNTDLTQNQDKAGTWWAAQSVSGNSLRVWSVNLPLPRPDPLSMSPVGERSRKEMLPNAQEDPTWTQNGTSGVLHGVQERTANSHSSAWKQEGGHTRSHGGLSAM